MPASLGNPVWKPLALASVLGLFLEMLLIRWISSEIRIFAYFKNFVLIASFMGFGLGYYLCRRKVNLLNFVLPLLFLSLVVQIPGAACLYFAAFLLRHRVSSPVKDPVNLSVQYRPQVQARRPLSSRATARFRY